MIDVEFKYVLKENIDVEISGTVYVPESEDADDSEFEIEFDTQNGSSSMVFVNHYGVGITPTEEQNYECDKLLEIFTKDYGFLTRVSDYAETNIALDLGDAYLVINDTDYREQFDL